MNTFLKFLLGTLLGALVLGLIVGLPLGFISWVLGMSWFASLCVTGLTALFITAGLVFRGKFKKSGHVPSRIIGNILIGVPLWGLVSWMGIRLYQGLGGVFFEDIALYWVGYFFVYVLLLGALAIFLRGMVDVSPKSDLYKGLVLAGAVVLLVMGWNTYRHPYSFDTNGGILGRDSAELAYKWVPSVEDQFDSVTGEPLSDEELAEQVPGPGWYMVRREVSTSADDGAKFVPYRDNLFHRNALECIRQEARDGNVIRVRVPASCEVSDSNSNSEDDPEGDSTTGSTVGGSSSTTAGNSGGGILQAGNGSTKWIVGICTLIGIFFAFAASDSMWAFVGVGAGLVFSLLWGTMQTGDLGHFARTPAAIPQVLTLTPGEWVGMGLVDVFDQEQLGDELLVIPCGSAAAPNATFEIRTEEAGIRSSPSKVHRVSEAGIPLRGTALRAGRPGRITHQRNLGDRGPTNLRLQLTSSVPVDVVVTTRQADPTLVEGLCIDVGRATAATVRVKSSMLCLQGKGPLPGQPHSACAADWN